MREKVKAIYGVRSEESDAYGLPKFVDVATEIGDDDPWMYLKENCIGEEKFRFRKGRTEITDFTCRYLDGKQNPIVWFKGVPEDKIARYIDFMKRYAKAARKYDCPRIVLEVRGGKVDVIHASEDICELSWGQYVKEFDALTFCNILISEKDISEPWKIYLANLISGVCMDDGELCGTLLQDETEELKNVDVFTWLEKAKQLYENRGVRDAMQPEGKQHILYLSREGKHESIEKRIWEAQVRSVFPLIEMERRSFIKKYEIKIRNALHDYGEHIVQFDKHISDPYEAELGTLCYMLRNYMTLRDAEAKKRLELLHDCRNKLAHGKFCEASEIKQILDGIGFFDIQIDGADER